MHSRRIFLKTLAPAAVALTLPAKSEASQDDICRFYADRLAEAMKARHGGNWVADVNHEALGAFVFKAVD